MSVLFACIIIIMHLVLCLLLKYFYQQEVSLEMYLVRFLKTVL